MLQQGTVAALRACTTDARAFSGQCLLAAEKAASDETAALLLVRNGAMELLAVWMTVHRKDAGVQTAGCRLYAACCGDAYGKPSEGRDKASSAGVAAVCDALRAHPENPAVQAAGCNTLCLFGRSPRLVAGRADAVSAVVQALRTHAADAAVAEAACSALRNLGLEEAGRARCGSEGALQCAVEALRRHATPGVQEQAAGALVNLTAHSRENTALAVDAGALEALTAVLSSRLPGVQLTCCIAIFNLTHVLASAQRRARQAGAPAALRSLLSGLPRGAPSAASSALRDTAQRTLRNVETS